MTVLQEGDRTWYLVGTAHVSEQSVTEVRDLVRSIRPDTVCVELDRTRYEALTDDQRWQKLDVFQVIRDGKVLMLLANLALGAYQRRLGAKLGVKPGAELLAGVQAAEEIDAELHLVDRDIQTTLRRTWANVPFWKKLQLLAAVVGATVSREEVSEEMIEELKQEQQLSEMLAEFAKVMPEVQEPLIDERDRYMASKIRDVPGERIVAVVGAAHVPGMKRWFGHPIDRERLEQQPPKKRWTGLLKWILPALVLVAFYFGYTKHEGQTLNEMLMAWILPNSILAGVLTAVARATIPSILTAFVASPITSLNPLLGAGMVVGLLEAWLRKPTVEDAERINDDVQSLRGFYRNPFTRVLLVAFMATLGSAMGAWVGATWLVALIP
ncbi:MAG: TraB/GumN family protein [Myxococcota bacterium]